MMPKKYKTRELRTLSLLILVALLAVLSAPSHSDSVALAQGTAPELTATSRVASQVELSWTEVSGASYVIARYDRTARRWETIEGSYSGTSRTDSSVQAGRSYTYQISADGRNTWSNQETVFVGHYDAPTLNTPTVSTLPSMIDVSWSAVAGTDNYDLWRFEQTEGWQQVADGQTGTSYSDTSVNIGRNYLYQVQAHGALGAGAWSAQQSATVPRTAPSMPVNLAASPGDAQVMLSWTAPLYDGGSVITGYQYRYQMAGGAWSTWMATTPVLSRAATVSSLTNGSDHNFEVRAQNATGDGAIATAMARPMSTVPGTPMNLRSTGVGPNEIMLAWDAVAGATGYAIQRRVNGGNWVDLTGVSGMAHTDTGLTPSTSYDYEIKATNNSGDSPWSGTLTVSTGPPQEPAAPTLMASASGFTVTLSWTAPDNGGAPITGYQIQDSDDGSTWSDFAAPAADATSSEHVLAAGTMKYYQIRAINSVGNGAWSTMQSAAVAPAAPSLMAEAGYRMVVLTWTVSGAAPITSYRIEKEDDRSMWATKATLPGNTDPLRYTDTGLDDSSQHTYRIIAINAAGESGESNSVDATTLAEAPEAPSAPTGLTATAGPGMITLRWGAPALTGGAPILSYEYRHKKTTGGTYGNWMNVGLETSVEVTGLTPDTAYSFAVRARNSIGPGAEVETAEAGVTPEDTAPTGMVTTLRAVISDIAADGDDDVTLTWTILLATDPALNGGSDITGYTVQSKTSEDDDDDWAALTGTPSTTGSTTTLLHEDLMPGTTYQYRIRADNTEGGGPWSAVVEVTTDPDAPGAPTLHPVAGDTGADPPQAAWVLDVNSITIKWSAPTNNGGAAITGYEVWVGTPATGQTDCTSDTTTREPNVTGLPAMRLEFVHVGLQSETTYCYRVRARNGSGNDRVSDWSSELTGATTATEAGTPGVPTGLSATPGTIAAGTADQITLGWTAPTEVGESPVLRYEIQFRQDDDATDETDAEWAGVTDLLMPTPPAAEAFTHEDLLGLKRYVYRVRAANAVGAGDWSDDAAATTVARAASDPTLTATAVGTDEILLEWTMSDDNGSSFDGYVIQRWDPTAGTPAWSADIAVDGATTTVYNDLGADGTGLAAGTEYSYRIRARAGSPVAEFGTDNTIADADDSATTMASVPDPPTLTIPASGDDDAPTTDSITLEWTPPTVTGGSVITGYELQKWMSGRWAPEANLAASARSHKDEDLEPSTTYYYRLRARNNIGDGGWSAIVSPATTAGAPEAPALMADATGRASVRLTWTVPDDNGTPITGYQIQQWDEDTTAWVAVSGDRGTDTNTDTVTEHTVTGLEAGTEYFYRIRALTGGTTEGEWSAPDDSTNGARSVTTEGDTPGAPTFTASTGWTTTTSSIEVEWEQPADIGGSAITGYELQKWMNGDWVPEATLGVALTHTDSGLTAGMTYYYRVRARNDQGDGDWSMHTSAMTDDANPDAPVLTAMAASTTSIRLTWNVPAANGDTIVGYVLQKFVGSSWDTDNLLGTDTNRTLYVDTMLEKGTTYYYRIMTDGTTNDSSWSVVVSVATLAGAPDRPTLMAMADGKTAIDLSWNAPDANGSAIVRYELQMWDSGRRLWTDVRDDLPSTRTSYKHMGREAGTRYVYRLRAVNRAADNDGLGMWSTIKFASTDE